MNLKDRLVHRLRTQPKAQSIVEFALALPILLMLLFGIIEFGRLLQAWLAVENAARFGVRYAVTGSYNSSYCAAAGDALGLTAADNADGTIDCQVPDTVTDYEDKMAQLQDWARLPSIRDAALSGGMGVAADPSVSGNYIAFLSNPSPSFTSANRGSPDQQGYFNVTTCSNRGVPPNSRFMFDPNPYFSDPSNQDQYLFPQVCEMADQNTFQPQEFIDDAGGPGDRVRVIITYRHPLITPFLSNLWPTLRLTAQREGIVEKFRTSRVTGLSGGISFAPTWTPTPSITPTPSLTPTITQTSTPFPCAGNGVLRQWWLNISGTSVSNLTSSPNYPYNPNGSEIRSSFDAPVNWADNYGTRMRASLCVPVTGEYSFWIASDDNGQLLLNGQVIASVDGWTNHNEWYKYGAQHSATLILQGGVFYSLEALQKEGGGGDNLSVAWSRPGDAGPTILAAPYIYAVQPEPTRTPTNTATVTPTGCPSNGTGLRGEYYGDQSLTGLVAAETDPTINYDWGGNAPNVPGMPVDHFSVRWTGQILAPYTGTYTFTTYTDDGARLYVNNTTVISDWTDHGVKYVNGSSINLTACQKYNITMEYYENGGSAVAKLFWSMDGSSRQIVPQIYLYPGTGFLPPTRTPSFTPTPSKSPTITLTPTKTLTPTITLTPTKTLKPSKTPTPSNTPRPSNTPTHTHTPIATATFTPRPSNTPSLTPRPSNTPTPCLTPFEMGGCH